MYKDYGMIRMVSCEVHTAQASTCASNRWSICYRPGHYRRLASLYPPSVHCGGRRDLHPTSQPVYQDLQSRDTVKQILATCRQELSPLYLRVSNIKVGILLPERHICDFWYHKFLRLRDVTPVETWCIKGKSWLHRMMFYRYYNKSVGEGSNGIMKQSLCLTQIFCEFIHRLSWYIINTTFY